ncbi:MAG: polysaccharide biosynthesis/export family protein [Bryobacterales bacterium]|nr:polysaccharide biosynthesis/export family protein [Bryobacterales bacterium]
MNRWVLPLAGPCGRTAYILAVALAGLCCLGQEQSAPYRFKPGDEFQVRVLNVPDLNAAVRVLPDGTISLVLLGEIKAAGLTLPELRTLITEGYSKHYRDPRVGVIVTDLADLNVYVSGQVGKAGKIALTPNLTAMQAVAEAGGLLKNAKADDAVIFRRLENGESQTIRIDLNRITEEGQKSDVVLQASDVIFVPKSEIDVYVTGEVIHPGLVPLAGHLSAMSAIAHAGGVTPRANPKTAFILRDDGDKGVRVIPFNFAAALRGGSDAQLRPFDVVVVPESGIAKVNKAIEQYVRQLLPADLSAGFTYILGGSVLR